MTISLGWQYEGPDTSVGIFGYTVWHEKCEVSDSWESCDATDTETLVGLTFTPRNGYVEVKSRTRFTCPACGATADMYDTDISSIGEE